MKKRIFVIFACVVMLFMAMTLTACGNEAEELQTQIYLLETEKAELQSTISSLQSDLDGARLNLTQAQGELNELRALLEAAQEPEEPPEESQPGAEQGGALAITYGGRPNPDMTWPYTSNLQLGLRVDLDELYEEDEIVWRSTNEAIFTVAPNEDGTRATVTPRANGSAEIVVTIGDGEETRQETRSWVRITGFD